MSTSKFVPLALPWPVGLFFVALWLHGFSSGLTGFVEAFREGGVVAYGVIVLSFVSSTIAAALVAIGAPRPIAVAVVLLPWLGGSLGSMVGMHQVMSAIGAVNVADKATILAEGTAEVLANRVFGAVATAGCAFGLAVSFALRVKKDGMGALAGAGVAFAAFGLAVGSVLEANAYRDVFKAAAQSMMADRAVLMAAGMEALSMVKPVTAVLCIVGLIVATAAVVVGKRDVVGVVVAALMLPLAPLVDGFVLKEPGEVAHRFHEVPWAADYPAFTAVTVDASAGGDWRAVLTDKDVVVNGKIVAEGPAIYEAIKALGTNHLNVLVDARAPALNVQRLVEAAMAADVTTLEIVGASPKPSAALESLHVSTFVRDMMAPPPAASIELPIGCTVVDGDPGCADVEKFANAAALVDFFVKAKADHKEVGLGRPAVGAVPSDDVIGASKLQALFGDGALGEGAIRGLGVKDRSDPGSPVVLGSLDKELISRVVKTHLAQVQFCYERELTKHPSLAGKVKVKFVVNGEGRVSQAQVEETTMNDAAVEGCLTARIKTWVFPKPKGGGIVIVSYPFVFKAAP